MKSLVFAILVVIAMTYTAAATGELGFRVTKPLARRTSSGHSVSSSVLTLKRGGKAAKSSSYLKTLRAVSALDHERHAHGGAIPVDDLLSVEYVTEIAWNGIPVNVIIDTGSSDPSLSANSIGNILPPALQRLRSRVLLSQIISFERT